MCIALLGGCLPPAHYCLLTARLLPLPPPPGPLACRALQKGTYQVAVNYDTLFCAGHTWTSDGTLVAAGGDMGGWLPDVLNSNSIFE